MRLPIFMALIGLTITSCGPSAQEKAAIENEVMQKLKAKEDSIAAAKSAEEAAISAQKQHDDSIANSVASTYQTKEKAEKTQSEVVSLQKMLLDCDGQLAVLKDRQKRDAEFHIGRTTQERESTLRNDQISIDNLKMRMVKINNRLQNLQASIRK